MRTAIRLERIADNQVAYEIILRLLDGEDVRKLIGVKPKKGRRLEDAEVALAAHYWIRRRQLKERQKIAARTVAEAWGRKESDVLKLASKHKAMAYEGPLLPSSLTFCEQFAADAKRLKRLDFTYNWP
jgi:hypothetical protein